MNDLIPKIARHQWQRDSRMRERKKSGAGRVFKGLILFCIMLPLGLYGIGLAFVMLVAVLTSARDKMTNRERQPTTLLEQQQEASLKEREERREDEARETLRIKHEAQSDAAAVEASVRVWKELERKQMKERTHLSSSATSGK